MSRNKPLSPAQIEALMQVAHGFVFYKPCGGRALGCRNDTFHALQRNKLVEIHYLPQNPTHPARLHRHAVLLTDAGRAALKEAGR